MELRHLNVNLRACQKLKVLMLRPKKAVLERAPTATAGLDLSISRELASRIGKSAGRALRLLVIGPDCFWLERDSYAAAPRYGKAWPLAIARKDPFQAAEMATSLNDRDWAFLADERVPMIEDGPRVEPDPVRDIETLLRDHWDYAGLNSCLIVRNDI